MSPPKRRAHSRLRGQPDPLLILQELSTNADIYEEGMATTAPSSGAEGRVHVRPVNPFIAEVLPPRAQQAAITREGGRAGARLKPRSSAGPGARSRPTRTLERFSEAPQKCVPRRPRTPTPGPAAGALRRGAGRGLHPGLRCDSHLPNMLSASPTADAAPLTSAARAAFPRPA